MASIIGVGSSFCCGQVTLVSLVAWSNSAEKRCFCRLWMTVGQTPECERQTSRKSERVEGKDPQVFFRGYSLNNACFQTDPQTPVNSSSMLFSGCSKRLYTQTVLGVGREGPFSLPNSGLETLSCLPATSVAGWPAYGLLEGFPFASA